MPPIGCGPQKLHPAPKLAALSDSVESLDGIYGLDFVGCRGVGFE